MPTKIISTINNNNIVKNIKSMIKNICLNMAQNWKEESKWTLKINKNIQVELERVAKYCPKIKNKIYLKWTKIQDIQLM